MRGVRLRRNLGAPRSALLEAVPGVIYGFGSVENPIPEGFADWMERRPIFQQVHGTAIDQVIQIRQDCGPRDGFWTEAPGVAIGVMTADCLPILLARKSGGCVAALHSGWRGTRARLIRTFWSSMAQRGEDPKDWVAVIGPAIGACCYEVSSDLIQEFQNEFKDLDPEGQRVSPTLRKLDLKAIVHLELLALGFEAVEILPFCTLCAETPSFHSFRREGGGTRQWSLIQISPPS